MNGMRRALVIVGLAVAGSLAAVPAVLALDRPAATAGDQRAGFFPYPELIAGHFVAGPVEATSGTVTLSPFPAAVRSVNAQPAPLDAGPPDGRAEMAWFAGHRLEMIGPQGRVIGGYGRDQAVRVMPRGGDGQPSAEREFDWTPLLILGGLLIAGGGVFWLCSARRPT